MDQTEVIHWKLGDLLLVIQIRAEAEKMEVELEEEFIGWYTTEEERNAASLEFYNSSKIRHV